VGSDKPITSILADGFGLQSGWQTWYTVSGFNKNPGDSSHGDSFHLTSLDGAEVSLEFYGAHLCIFCGIDHSGSQFFCKFLVQAARFIFTVLRMLHMKWSSTMLRSRYLPQQTYCIRATG
jgi:hypothetical protein